MSPSQLFDLWAPPTSAWSRWAKPILFAELTTTASIDVNEPLPSVHIRAERTRAVVLDLPAASSVKAGLALLEAGFRPVPLFNGNRGPLVLNIGGSALIDNDPIVAWLAAGAALLERHSLPFDAPPAFLLDSRRKPQVAPAPGRYDNRWVVFPQDFPSANFLKSQGIAEVVLIQQDAQAQPQEDLAHVLRRWQEAGLTMRVAALEAASEPQPLQVNRPSWFCSLWYSALALMGLRRNSAGGFGSIVPQPSSGGA